MRSTNQPKRTQKSPAHKKAAVQCISGFFVGGSELLQRLAQRGRGYLELFAVFGDGAAGTFDALLLEHIGQFSVR